MMSSTKAFIVVGIIAMAAVGWLSYKFNASRTIHWDFVEGHGVATVGWPDKNRGDFYAIDADRELVINMSNGRHYDGKISNFSVNRNGQYVGSIVVIGRNLSIEEARIEMGNLIRKFHLTHDGSEGRAIQELSQWSGKRASDSFSAGLGGAEPQMFAEFHTSFNEEKPWCIEITLSWGNGATSARGK